MHKKIRGENMGNGKDTAMPRRATPALIIVLPRAQGPYLGDIRKAIRSRLEEGRKSGNDSVTFIEDGNGRATEDCEIFREARGMGFLEIVLETDGRTYLSFDDAVRAAESGLARVDIRVPIVGGRPSVRAGAAAVRNFALLHAQGKIKLRPTFGIRSPIVKKDPPRWGNDRKISDYLPLEDWENEAGSDLSGWLLDRYGIPEAKIRRYRHHACNDVFLAMSGNLHFVVKEFNKPFIEAAFNLEQDSVPAMKARGIRIPEAITDKEGLRHSSVTGKTRVVYAYLPGRPLDFSRPEDIGTLADGLANMHAATLAEPYAGERNPAEGKAVESARQENPELTEALLRVAAGSHWRAEKLPRALLHGNINRNHCSIREDGINIFDWESARIGPAIIDVTRTAYYAAYRNNDERLSFETLDWFLARYRSGRKLEKEEEEAVGPLMACWFLKDVGVMARQADEFDESDRKRHAEQSWRFLRSGWPNGKNLQ